VASVVTPIESVDFRHSLITAASCWLAAVFVFWLHCDNPWWAVTSAWVVSSSDFHASSLKAIMRIAGTLAGYLVGLTCASLTEGNPAGQAVVLFSIGAIGTSMRYRSQFSYAWVIGSATAFILVVLDITNPGSVYDTGLFRVYEVISGIIAAALCQRLLAPLLGLANPSMINANPPSAVAPGTGFGTMAMLGGLTPVVITVIWSWQNLPSLVQTIATTFVTIDRTLSASQSRITQRILGCLLGGCVGLLAAAFAFSWWVWSMMLFGGIFAFSRLHLSKGPSSYIGTQGGVAFIMAMVTGNHAPNTIDPVIGRVAGITGGVLVVAAIGLVSGLRQEKSRDEKA
jgi:uncharacterized membrane protein YccC